MQNELTVIPPQELVRQSTDIAGLLKEIVLKSAIEIQHRKYVKVEGWQSIATAHGCIASSRDVELIPGGYRAIGEVRRMSDGALLSTAEGFVGEDEPTWFGGEAEVWDKASRRRVKKTLDKRPDYAIRAMAQTRAISRACRSAFAHVVVLMDAGLSTTPAEEVPHGGFQDAIDTDQARDDAAAGNKNSPVLATHVHFGKNKDTAIAELNGRQLAWYRDNYEAQTEKGKRHSDADTALYEAVKAELEKRKTPLPPGPDPGDQLPMFNGPNHQNLAGMLDFNSISREDFMSAMKLAEMIPKAAVSFGAMKDETAKMFIEDFDNVLIAVKSWRDKQ